MCLSYNRKEFYLTVGSKYNRVLALFYREDQGARSLYIKGNFMILSFDVYFNKPEFTSFPIVNSY